MTKPKVIKWTGGLLLSTVVGSGMIAGGIYMNDFLNPGDETVPAESPAVYADFMPVNIVLAGTGMTTGTLVGHASPLVRTVSGSNVATASGFWLDVSYENIANPNAVSLDICLAAAPTSATGSHVCFFQNTSSVTGATVVLPLTTTIANHMWNGDLYLIARPNGAKNPTTSFRARIRGHLHQTAGQ